MPSEFSMVYLYRSSNHVTAPSHYPENKLYH